MPVGTFDESGRTFDQIGEPFDNDNQLNGTGTFSTPLPAIGGVGFVQTMGRLYAGGTVAPVTPAWHSGWEVTDTHTSAYRLLRALPGVVSPAFFYDTNASSIPGGGLPSTNPDAGLVRLVSDELATQTLKGTIRGWLPALVSYSAVEASAQWRVSLVNPDGTLKALLANYDTTALAHAFAHDDYRPRQWPKTGAFAIPNTECAAGDRLLFEIGARIWGTTGQPAGAATTTGRDDTTTIDLPENEALSYDGTLHHGWFEFSALPIFADKLGQGAFAHKKPVINGVGTLKEAPGVGGFEAPLPKLDGIGTVKGVTKVHGYEVQLQVRCDEDSPLWRSPIWEKTVSPPTRISVTDPHADPEDEAHVGGPAPTQFTGELSDQMAVAAATLRDPQVASAPDDLHVFRLFNDKPVQRSAVKNALKLCSYDFDRVLRRFERASGKDKVPIRFVNMHAVLDFPSTMTIWGYCDSLGTINIEQSLRNTDSSPTRLEEVILSEMAHVVDRFGLSNNDRDRIKDLMGVPNNVPWRPDVPLSQYHVKPAECFMDVFIRCFTEHFHLTITGFKYGLNDHKKQIRKLIYPDWSPPGGGPDEPPDDPGDGGGTGDGTVEVAFVKDKYDGPDLPVGEYSLRYRVWNDEGAYAKWAYDHSLAITGPNSYSVEPDFSAHTAYPKAKLKLSIFDMESPEHEEDATQIADPGEGQYSRGPGVLKAVIYDLGNLGISAYTATPGELHFTLPNGHPQLSECLPFERHYKLESFARTGWRTLHEGLLTDIDVSTDDTIVYGMNYLGLLNLSVETAKQPDGDVDAPMHPGDDGPSGSKYIQKDIAVAHPPTANQSNALGIVNDQLDRALKEEDSPLGWVELGRIDAMPEPVTIYSAFVQRLTFIRSLMDSYASGTGVRSRIKVERDRADLDLEKISVIEDDGEDRPNLRLEYGSLLQGFELIPFGDFAIRVHGIGHQAMSAKPFYAARTAYGMDPQRWGSIAKVAVWSEVADENDLARKVLQRAAEFARIGKGVAIAIRVRGLDPFDGWDLADALPLSVSHGPVDTSYWQPDDQGLSWWVIWGMQWLVNTDGSDELVLIVKPRIDNTQVLPDTDNKPLLKPNAKHLSVDWQLADLPPTEPANMLLGVDIAPAFQPGFDVGDVKKAGGDFVMVKLTQGTYFQWKAKAHAWIADAKAKGMIVGVYHFGTRVLKKDGSGDPVAFNTGDKQCDYFIERLPNKSPEGLLIALDVESNGDDDKPAQSFVGPDGKTYVPDKSGMRKSQLNQFVKRWFQRFPNHPLFIYSSINQYPANNPDMRELSPLTYPWTANWQTKPDGDLPRTWDKLDPLDINFNVPRFGGMGRPKLVQYGFVKLPGYPSAVDADAFHGTKADLASYAVSGSGGGDSDRPAYRAGYNGVLDLTITYASTADAGAGNTYHEQGEDDAQEDVADALNALRLSAPDA